MQPLFIFYIAGAVCSGAQRAALLDGYGRDPSFRSSRVLLAGRDEGNRGGRHVLQPPATSRRHSGQDCLFLFKYTIA